LKDKTKNRKRKQKAKNIRLFPVFSATPQCEATTLGSELQPHGISGSLQVTLCDDLRYLQWEQVQLMAEISSQYEGELAIFDKGISRYASGVVGYRMQPEDIRLQSTVAPLALSVH